MKQKIRLLACLLVAISCFGGTRSVNLASGSYTLGAAFSSIGDNTLTIRIHNWSIPGSLQDVYCTGAGGNCLRMDASSNFMLAIFKDTTGSLPTINVNGMGDFIARLSRNTTGMSYTMEVFNTATGACVSATTNISALGSNNWSGSGGGFGGGVTARVAYFRWSTGLPATICANMPLETDPPGNLLDYEFENNFTDSSPHAVGLIMASTFAATPAYAPTCQGQDSSSPTPIHAIRASTATSINWVKCISESTGSALNYVWTTGTCPNSSLSNTNIANLNATISLPGQCTLNLSVSDSVPNITHVAVTFGVVTTNAQDIVQTGNPLLDQILGPMLRFGADSDASNVSSANGITTFFDDRNQAWAQLMGNAQSTVAYYQDQWNTALPGTITVTTSGGKTTVTGIGTNFKNDFCGGGTTAAAKTLFIAWIPDARAVGGTKRVPLPVGGSFTCPSATSIVLSNPYNGPTGTSGMNYSVWTTADNWVGGSENVNYYDNVMAFYSLYYRTGLTIFRDYARTLGDRWFTMPDIDQGLADCNVDICVQGPRIVSFTGLVLRALDGRPDMWPGLRTWTDTSARQLTWLGDIRESAYLVSQQALCGIADPDTAPMGHRATCQQRVADAIANVWLPAQLPDGSWTEELGGNAVYVVCTWCGTVSGTITVTTGSADAVTSGSGWVSNPFPSTCISNGLCSLWITPTTSTPGTNAGGDTQTYHVTWDPSSPTHLTLDRPYDGIYSGSSRGFSLGVLVGFGTQPFMMGVVGGAMNYAYQSLNGFRSLNASCPGGTNQGCARQFTQDAAKWIASTGTITNFQNTNYDGLFYARGFMNCNTLEKALHDVNCSQVLNGQDYYIQGIRYLNMEIMHGFCGAYVLSNDQSIHDSGNLLFSAAYGPSDSHYLFGTLNSGSYDWNTFKAKTFGFGFGWGLGACWQAARRLSPNLSSTVSPPSFFSANTQ